MWILLRVAILVGILVLGVTCGIFYERGKIAQSALSGVASALLLVLALVYGGPPIASDELNSDLQVDKANLRK